MLKLKISALVMVAALCAPALAASVDDLLTMAKNGVAEPVMLAWAEQQHMILTADDVVRLTTAKVPDSVITTIIRQGKIVAQRAAPPAPVAEEYPPPEERTVVEREVGVP